MEEKIVEEKDMQGERGGFEETTPLPLHPLSPQNLLERYRDMQGEKGGFKETTPLPLHPLSPKPFGTAEKGG